MQYAINCFVIDSNIEDQKIFNTALEAIDPNIACFFADNGISGLKILNSDIFFIPSFIFVELNMSLMNGIQCLKEIKKINRFKKVPVYIYAKAANPASIAEAKNLGAANIIIKPDGLKRLTELLSRLFQLQKSLTF